MCKFTDKKGCLHYKFLGVLTPADDSEHLAVFSEYGDTKVKVFYTSNQLRMARENFLKLNNEIQALEFSDALTRLK